MRKVLFVAYQFPPRGGPGVQRSIALVKNLREFGYEPVVLTTTSDDVKAGNYNYDESLLNSLPAGVEIVRIAANEPLAFVRFLMKLRIYRLFWFAGYRWLWEWSLKWSANVIPVAKDLIRKHNIELVYTTSGPYSSLLVGEELQREMNIKWVADMRDPFTDAYAWQFPSRLHWKNRRNWEAQILSKPDKLVVNTPEVKSLYLSRKLIAPEKITVITNGY